MLVLTVDCLVLKKTGGRLNSNDRIALEDRLVDGLVNLRLVGG